MSLIEELLEYKKGVCDRRWKKSQKISYKNDYIDLVSLDSSNKWLSSTEMEKQWSIIINKKKEFSSLPNFLLLKERGLLTLPRTGYVVSIALIFFSMYFGMGFIFSIFILLYLQCVSEYLK